MINVVSILIQCTFDNSSYCKEALPLFPGCFLCFHTKVHGALGFSPSPLIKSRTLLEGIKSIRPMPLFYRCILDQTRFLLENVITFLGSCTSRSMIASNFPRLPILYGFLQNNMKTHQQFVLGGYMQATHENLFNECIHMPSARFQYIKPIYQYAYPYRIKYCSSMLK